MYHYIFDMESGKILQMVCSPAFKLAHYEPHFLALGYTRIDVLSSDANVAATEVVNGALIERQGDTHL